MSSDCSERCFCSPNNGLTCHEAGCPSGHVCEIQAGVRECQAARGLCSISVGANLTTFDGAHNAISSPGVYELSSRCPGLQKNVPWYRVLADVQPCHNNDKIVSKVHIFFQDGMVTVIPSKGTWVSLGTEGRAIFPGFPSPCHDVLHPVSPSDLEVCFLHPGLYTFLWICTCLSMSAWVLHLGLSSYIRVIG